jgi:hypothetical protein
MIVPARGSFHRNDRSTRTLNFEKVPSEGKKRRTHAAKRNDLLVMRGRRRRETADISAIAETSARSRDLFVVRSSSFVKRISLGIRADS